MRLNPTAFQVLFCCAAAVTLCMISCTGPLPVCGDEICGLGENLLCPQDCQVTNGDAPPDCGDRSCDAGENVTNCPEDCGPGEICGNGNCVAPENFLNCPQDCDDPCGNGHCDAGENVANCPEDCGGGELCGNALCGPGENISNCPQDCGPDEECGNGFCRGGESPESCSADCGTPRPICQDSDCDDGEFCNGAETCSISGECMRGTNPCDPNTEVCNSETAECEPIDSCGDGSCDDDESAQSCPQDCAALERYLSTVERAVDDRVYGPTVGVEIVTESPLPFDPNQPGDVRYSYTDRQQRRTAALERLVLSDNTIGKIYPGSLLWAKPIREGRLQQVGQITGRTPVKGAFENIVNIVALNNEAVPTSISFEHDGTYSEFLADAAQVFSGRSNGVGRLTTDFRISIDAKDALLAIGMSASAWFANVTSSLELVNNEDRSVAILTLDQVFYSAAIDQPDIVEGMVPLRLLQENATLAAALADGAEQGGELVYVRKVDYGRRILIALSASASEERLNAAVDAGFDAAIASGSINLRAEDREVWNTVEGKLIIIGGTYPEGITGIFRNVDEFVSAVRAIMSAQFVNNSQGALPVSFELEYLDRTPMQVFETAEFSGRIPAVHSRRSAITESVSTNRAHATPRAGDHEIDSDDWTLVQISGQAVSLLPNGQIQFSLVWEAREGNGNQSFGDTWFHSTRNFTFGAPARVLEIIGPTSFPPFPHWLRGGIANVFVGIPDNGFLRGITAKVDSGDDNDWEDQELRATFSVSVWLAP